MLLPITWRLIITLFIIQDKNKTFRTRLVAVWMLSNAGLAITIQSLNGTPSGDEAKDQKQLQAKQHVYFAILLWSTFGLAFVRFIGVSRPATFTYVLATDILL